MKVGFVEVMIKKYFPIVVVEIYLFLTLVLFIYGPISFVIHESTKFWFYIVLYQLFVFLGYLIGIKTTKSISAVDRVSFFPKKIYYSVLVLAVFSNLIFYKNVMMLDSYIPWDIFDQVMVGIDSSKEVYDERSARLTYYQGSKSLNIFYFFIAFSKPLLTVLYPMYFSKVSLPVKVISFFVIAFQLLVGFASGLNKPFFDFFLLLFLSMLTCFLISLFRKELLHKAKSGFFIIIPCLSFLLFVFVFSVAMSERGGDLTYFTSESISPLRDITVSHNSFNSPVFSFLYFVYVWLVYYLVQGYYGFSLSLTQDFDSTFGFGNSEFILRQWEWLSGYDISHLTYQAKISGVWHQSGQWHSLYSHIANDVHFSGVVVFMFSFGYYLSRVWLHALDSNNIFAKALIPLCGVFVVFIPANNQVFGYIETISYFVMVNLFWFLSRKNFFKQSINNM